MVLLLRWWRAAVLAVALLVAGVVAPHWDQRAFALQVVFSIMPVLCWLVAAPRSVAAPVIGFVLAGLSVVPGVVLGPGGFSMYRVVPAGVWVVVLYLPLGLLASTIAALVLDYLVRRRPAEAPMSGGPSSRTRIVAVLSLFAVIICGLECRGLELSLENGETPVAPTAAIVGMLPAGLTVVGEPNWDGGSSVSGMSYDIISTRGWSPNEIADKLADFIARLTDWPVPG